MHVHIYIYNLVLSCLSPKPRWWVKPWRWLLQNNDIIIDDYFWIMGKIGFFYMGWEKWTGFNSEHKENVVLFFPFLKHRINKGDNHLVEAFNKCMSLSSLLLCVWRWKIILKKICSLLDEIFSFYKVTQLQKWLPKIEFIAFRKYCFKEIKMYVYGKKMVQEPKISQWPKLQQLCIHLCNN